MNNAYVEDPIKYSEAILQIKYKCPHCGHKAIIPHGVKRQLCSWCKHWVYTDKKMEFREKFKEAKRRSEK